MLSHHTGSLNDQGQIYLMPDCMTGLDTVILMLLNALNILREFFGEIRMLDCTCIFKNRMD